MHPCPWPAGEGAITGWEVDVFLGTAEAKAGTAFEAGSRYALLIFRRQPAGAAPDEKAARKEAAAAGWRAIRLERSRRLPATARPDQPVLLAAFEDALREGGSVVAHQRRERERGDPP